MANKNIQHWEKLGLLYDPNIHSSHPWMNSHAAVPFLEFDVVNKDHIKLFFTVRNQENKSLTAWAKFDMSDLFSGPVELAENPILPLGKTGEFDEDGVMGCHITALQDGIYFYYIGWNLATSVPFRNSVGAAKYDPLSRKFKKVFKGPVVDRSIHDACFVASNCIFAEDGFYRLYYLSCDEWIRTASGWSHKYNIKYATSKDGIHWDKEGKVAIDFKYDNEYAISVPRVLKEDNLYKMWYSYRGGPNTENYQIGYAESRDGIDWTRKDEYVVFENSDEHWDNDMQCYPFIFDHNNERYMLYNGNGYGKTGIGIARLKQHM